VPLSVSIVTAERSVVQRDDVLRLIVPTMEGQITILPSHAPLMGALAIGELVAVVPGGEEVIAIHGGFLQVADDKVILLADAAERSEDIDEARADAARQRAQARLSGQHAGAEALDMLRAQLALQRALIRIKVSSRRNRTGAPTPQR